MGVSLPQVSSNICFITVQQRQQTYPIGIQTFSKLRAEQYVYVDKTELIHKLVTEGNYYFLSRPRRFGKSLLVSTLKSLFLGEKQHFAGLWIANRRDWGQTRPVIHLQFSSLNYQQLGLEAALIKELRAIAVTFGVVLEETTAKDLFRELITGVAGQSNPNYPGVAILIDEYDKPIIDYLEDTEQAEVNRVLLKNFYSVIKDADPYIGFFFLTGVSRFPKVSIFSDLNNLDDISMRADFSTLTGITHQELTQYFAVEIETISQTKAVTPDDLIEKIRFWYNGYSWNNGLNRVYNPFSLLRFFAGGGDFRNFWFETGTPTFLVNQLKNQHLFAPSPVKADDTMLSSFDSANLNPITLLFQTGYLTIADYQESRLLYTLTYPNEEVRVSLTQSLLNAYRADQQGQSLPLVVQLEDALTTNDIASVVAVMNALFAALPYDLWQYQNEKFYHAILHLSFTLLGTFIQSEIHTARGRCDALVQTAQFVYAFEFKLDKTADEALAQIYDRGYLDAYGPGGKTRVAVGINFSSRQKAVEGYRVEVLS